MLHKTKPLALISEGNIKEALGLLDQMLIHGLHHTELLHLKFRHNDLQRRIRSGSMENAAETKETNALSMHLIEFVSQIEEREFLNQILLVSPKGKGNEQMATQLRVLFPSLATDESGHLVNGDFAFVVINDLDKNLPADEQVIFDDLIARYAEKYYLVVGTHVFGKKIVKESDRIHAANSIFALPARMREMMDFVRYFKPA